MKIIGTALHLIEVPMRVPLKFGAESLTEVTCARARVRVRGTDGTEADGWGETPLSVAWVWPSAELGHRERHAALVDFTRRVAREVGGFAGAGHPIEIGHAFLAKPLPALQAAFNAERAPGAALPHLAALVAFSAFDLAVHDAFGRLHGVPVFETYGARWLGRDLAHFLDPDPGSGVSFRGRHPAEFLRPRQDRLPVWHLVGGLDPLDESELSGDEPDDGYPVVLGDWIRRDGLRCLKIKLRGTDAEWDFRRLVRVGRIGGGLGVEWLSADFNCTVTDPAYVIEVLDRLRADEPAIFDRLLYVEQPFPYDLEAHRIDVRAVSARKPLFMDESAHDWTFVRLGRSLGWTGVALKTCKTQTGALLSLCWARAHGMDLMVQDLTNPMLAQIPHVLLAAHAGTLMGVESNAMQFYPEASRPEARIHPGLYRRRNGVLDLTSVRGPGFGYRLGEIERSLPDPVESAGSL